jgi:dihydrofolate reductase
MTFLSAPPGCIGSGHTWQPGHYTLGGDTPWHIEAIMEFFRKDSLDVVQVPRSKPARCF